MRLTNKVALVTGASRGIGAAVCRAYAREGASVVVNHYPDATRRESAERLVHDIRSQGGRAIAVGADVSDASAVTRMVETARSQFGVIDILVANAARFAISAWDSIDEDAWDQTLASNLKGTWLCCREVMPAMRERGWGKIITVSSVMVAVGATGALDYVSSKAALIGFTRSLAREVGREGVRVNCVAPGAIRTELEHDVRAAAPDAAEFSDAVQSLPGRGTVEDLVGPFVFLASHESDFVTGQVLMVDGGWAYF